MSASSFTTFTKRLGGWQDIGRKLPLLTTALLVATVIVVTVLAYAEMKRALVVAAGQRVVSAADEVGTALAASNTRLQRQPVAFSRDTTLLAVFHAPTSAALSAMRKQLEKARAANSQLAAIELWSLRGERVLRVGDSLAEVPALSARGASIGVGPLIAHGNTVIQDIVLPVVGARADTLGFLRELARISSSNQRQLLGGLIGEDAVLLIGNAKGDVWTDLTKRADGPRVRAQPGRVVRDAGRDGEPLIAAFAMVGRTPWTVWVAIPERAALAPARRFLLSMALVALLVVGLGALGAWRLSRNIIAPVAEVTHAAERMTAGDYSTRAVVARGDEVGRLAASFNQMAEAIQIAAANLESQQAELETQQIELEEANELLRANYDEAVHALEERKRLEAQLHQALKMEAIGRLAGGIAHDFNNILTVIVSYSDLVLADPALGDDARSDLEQVRAAAGRAASLTRQLLAFSRKQVLHPSVLDINEVVADVTKMLSRVIPTNITIRTRLAGGLDPVYVDRGQLEQVVMNLAVNARDAMPNGGSLVIETEAAMLDDAYMAMHPTGKAGPHVVLSVSDTGIGMDAETRARIFEPFFTTKGPGQGTGLGLATVYGIVQQSGGSVYVYSEPGHGTIFKLYFPAHVGAAEIDQATANVPVQEVGPLSVLLVEDDPAVRDAMRAVLESLGHEVQSASTATDALDVIQVCAADFDVVLTDAVMPGMSGLALAERLSQEHPDLPVVLMSGYSEEAVSGGRVLPPGVVFVEKPFTAQIISQAFRDVGAYAAADA